MDGHTTDPRSTTRARVVGIGASAGGLDAFERLLRHLPVDSGHAFVLVQHLDATHPSSLTQILGRATAMPVEEASDGVPVAPNRVYIIPPNTELTIRHRVLRVAPRTTAVPHMPINRFFQSLANDCGEEAIGVVLSGNGSDSAAGLRAIKDAGGMTFAQEPNSAEFSSMPSMAVAAGGVDVILPPETIASEMVRLARHPDVAFGVRDTPEGETAAEAGGDDLRRICDVMHEATGIDFGLYRETTVRRRTLRRVAVRNTATLGEYAQLLAGDPAERTTLQRDLLIGVTSFFRDPESFDALKAQVFPAILRDRAADATIRIWVPGCATGEEAYSILIALQEYQSDHHTAFPVQVFASDISEISLERARTGRYSDRIAANVSAERLDQYFWKVDDSYQIVKSIRDQCIFSRHNLLDDPPFSKIDLISCRNVLIYLDTVQKTIIPLFHYALVDHGFLMLGRSESARYAELFAPVDPRQKIYARRQVSRKPYESFARARSTHRGDDARRAPARPTHRAVDLSRAADRILLSKYSPAGVLVNEGLELLEIRGETAPFIALTSGKASFHLLKLVNDTGLFLAIETMIQEAATTQLTVRREGVPYEADGRPGTVTVEVTPLGSGANRAYLILFEPVGRVDPPSSAPPIGRTDGLGEQDQRVVILKRELAAARARLLSIVDEHETSDEENQQIAEDALSVNEELQSLTEELETAKEELQSTNEELLTVNREVEARNAALAAALELAKSIVETIRVPLVVIDAELQVRQINTAFATAFHVSPRSEEGRRFSALCDGAWDVAALQAPIARLSGDHRSFDPIEIAQSFPAIGPRVLRISGVPLEQLGAALLMIDDITDRREAEKALKASEDQRRQGEKMETVGRLAGGIAHDFNNLLTVIIGTADLVNDGLGPEHAEVAHLAELRAAADRAAALTDQLLSFSRKKVLQPKVFDLNLLVGDFERMLRRLLGEPIRIVTRLTGDPCPVLADPAEIGRVVMNLCLNAKDAMPAGGVLTIETSEVSLDENSAPQAEVLPGRYVRLVISDTGLGMDAETRAHAFEPFFTTKDVSQGVGLGLATVFGILQQSHGAVSCDSVLGEGTRFTVLLPVATRPADRTPIVNPTQVAKGSREVVLLVEDEDIVRRLTRKILERSGYVVLEARNGGDALSTLQSRQGQVALVITDVLMPEMSGGELARQVLRLWPTTKVLFVSGHAEDVLAKEGVTVGMPFLQKPYGMNDLARKIREVLGSVDG